MVLKLLVPAAVLTLAFALAWDPKEVKLPPPFATPSVDNGPHVVDQPEGAELKLPDGFHVDIYAEGFEQPRFMALGPGGELLVSDSTEQGVVYVLRRAEGIAQETDCRAQPAIRAGVLERLSLRGRADFDQALQI